MRRRKSRNMSKLTPEEKAERARQRMLNKAREFQTSTYSRRIVAPLFQRMCRAEAAADPRRYVTAVVDGEIRQVGRELGQCVCCTCGAVKKWDGGIKGIHAGHFLSSRRNSILYEPLNISPQCSHCNVYLSGAPQAFQQWMIAVRGEDVIEKLKRQKAKSVTFGRDELVDMRISYAARLKAAEERMIMGDRTIITG